MNSRLSSKVAAVVVGRGARSMSSSAKVWINKDTRVICQGFTGKQVQNMLQNGMPNALVVITDPTKTNEACSRRFSAPIINIKSDLLLENYLSALCFNRFSRWDGRIFDIFVYYA